jgi:hypothetical protein
MKSTANYMALGFLGMKIIFISVFSLLSKLGKPFHQRVLNELQRSGLSRRLMIWLLPRLLSPLFRQQGVSLSHSSCVSPVEQIIQYFLLSTKHRILLLKRTCNGTSGAM